jgi:hypothetical protein
MPDESRDPDHIPLPLIWDYANDPEALSKADTAHLQACYFCLCALGACRSSKSLNRAIELLRAEGLITD